MARKIILTGVLSVIVFFGVRALAYPEFYQLAEDQVRDRRNLIADDLEHGGDFFGAAALYSQDLSGTSGALNQQIATQQIGRILTTAQFSLGAIAGKDVPAFMQAQSIKFEDLKRKEAASWSVAVVAGFRVQEEAVVRVKGQVTDLQAQIIDIGSLAPLLLHVAEDQAKVEAGVAPSRRESQAAKDRVQAIDEQYEVSLRGRSVPLPTKALYLRIGGIPHELVEPTATKDATYAGLSGALLVWFVSAIRMPKGNTDVAN